MDWLLLRFLDFRLSIPDLEVKVAEIQLNGNREEVVEGTTIAGLLEAKGVNAKRVVVELNRRILPREEFGSAQLQPGDVVEIVTFVGGG